MKPTMLALALLAALVGFAACARYPVVVDTPSSTAAAPAPTR